MMDALRPLAIPPGDYMVPRPANMEELKSPAFAEKAKRGPVVVMTVMPNGIMSMGRNLAQWTVSRGPIRGKVFRDRKASSGRRG